jgi:hypothetical protein
MRWYSARAHNFTLILNNPYIYTQYNAGDVSRARTASTAPSTFLSLSIQSALQPAVIRAAYPRGTASQWSHVDLFLHNNLQRGWMRKTICPTDESTETAAKARRESTPVRVKRSCPNENVFPCPAQCVYFQIRIQNDPRTWRIVYFSQSRRKT